ncbi:MAG: zinc-ribbon domain-containing protein [Acidobacteriota bacterium]|nr:zinc-ribbon domain-containing protein [Acidobacteriota bacterium]
MIIRCDNCSVSLQLDEGKIPKGNFTVRCPRCQNMIRVAPGAKTVQQLKENAPAAAVQEGTQEFQAKESEFQINNAMRSLLSALQTENKVLDSNDDENVKPRRVLLCLGQTQELVAKTLVDAGFKVYLAETPAQANERLREGKTEVLIFSPDFAAEFGGAAMLQQKVNAMYAAERRRCYFVTIEDGGTTLSAHDAFLRNLNLIVNTSDISQLPLILNRALKDFNELYHYYNKAVGAEAV